MDVASRSRRRSTSPVKASQFFKIINSSVVHHQKLMIPGKFVRKCAKNLASHVFLKVPDGAIWEVESRILNGDVWLCEGWKVFARYYSIRYGHLLLFRYDGNSHFHVLIFDMSASEIEYPPFGATHRPQTNLINLHVDLQTQKREDARTYDSVDNLKDFPSGKRSRAGKETVEHVSTANLDVCPRSQTRKPAPYPTDKEEWINGDTAQRSQQSQISHKPLETGSTKLTALQRFINFQSSNPFFEVYMQPSYVNRRRLSIPNDFSRKYLSGKEKSVLLQVSDGRAWSAKCSWRKISCSSFVRDNNLKVGDVCIFELVVPGLEPRFNVIISRRGESQCALPLPLMKGKALGVKSEPI